MNYSGLLNILSQAGGWNLLGVNHPSSVLIVEDDAFLKPLLAKLLYAVDPELNLRWAKNAEEARIALKSGAPDLMIVDCLLGAGESGLELLKHCQLKHPKTEYLLMSGLSKETMAKLGRLEASSLPRSIQKPFHFRDFQSEVRALLPTPG